MGKYFDYSQKIKRQLVESKGLMEKLKNHMTIKNNNPLEKLQSIGEGNMNEVFQLGKLDSGIYIAVRQLNYPIYLRSTDTLLSNFESYCKQAEVLSPQEDIPRFCIGTFMIQNSALLVEDLSNGGSKKSKLNNKLKMSGDFLPKFDKFRYMNPENSIVFD